MNVVLTDVVINYPKLAEPKAFSEGDTPKYSGQFIVDKESKAAEILIGAIKKIKAEHYGAKKNPTSVCCRDGDTDPKAPKNGAASWFFSANSIKRPQTLDLQMNPIDASKIDGTDTVHVMISIYHTKKGGGRICAGLEGVVFVQQGDRNFGPSDEQNLSTFAQLLAEQNALPAEVQQNLLGETTVEAEVEVEEM